MNEATLVIQVKGSAGNATAGPAAGSMPGVSAGGREIGLRGRPLSDAELERVMERSFEKNAPGLMSRLGDTIGRIAGGGPSRTEATIRSIFGAGASGFNLFGGFGPKSNWVDPVTGKPSKENDAVFVPLFSKLDKTVSVLSAGTAGLLSASTRAVSATFGSVAPMAEKLKDFSPAISSVAASLEADRTMRRMQIAREEGPGVARANESFGKLANSIEQSFDKSMARLIGKLGEIFGPAAELVAKALDEWFDNGPPQAPGQFLMDLFRNTTGKLLPADNAIFSGRTDPLPANGGFVDLLRLPPIAPAMLGQLMSDEGKNRVF